MLDQDTKAQLGAYLEKIQKPIELVANLDDGESSREMRDLLKDIESLSDKVSLREERNDSLRIPSFAVNRVGGDMKIRFAGIPMGHEFTSLILALLQAGGHPPKVEQEVIDQIRAIDRELKFETYISLSCQNCPEVVQALNLMAVLNPKISHVMIDGALFQDEVENKQIMAVPNLYLDGESIGQGRMSVEEILKKVGGGGDDAAIAEKLTAREPYEVLIVGGGPAGAAAAIYAARKGIRTGVVTERFGGQVNDTMSIENFISVTETEGPKLVAAMEAHVAANEVEVIKMQRASKLVPATQQGGLHTLELEGGGRLRARSIIIATGARWRELNVPGEQEHRNKGVAYCPHCDGPLFKGKRVSVIGGGNSGVEAAIDLAGIVDHVTLIEYDPKLRADEVLQRKLKSMPNTRIVTNAQTTTVDGDGSRVKALRYKDRADNSEHEVALEGVFVQIGLLPNTGWLKDSAVKLSPRGEIEIDARAETSVPGIFAAGDVTTVPYKQIIISMGEGTKAALSAFDYLIRHSAPAEETAPARAVEDKAAA